MVVPDHRPIRFWIAGLPSERGRAWIAGCRKRRPRRPHLLRERLSLRRIARALLAALRVVKTEREMVNTLAQNWSQRTRSPACILVPKPFVIAAVQEYGMHSVAVPPLGCGNGGLDWNAVRPRIEAAFAALSDVHSYSMPLRVPQMQTRCA